MKVEFNKEAPIEERVNFLEKLFKRLMLKSKKKTSVIIPPFPISGELTQESNELTYLFPCNGRVSKAAIVLDKKPENPVMIDLELMGEITGTSKRVLVDQKITITEPEVSVSTLDKLTLTAEGEFKTLSIGILWIPEVSEGDLKNAFIKNLEEELLEEL